MRTPSWDEESDPELDAMDLDKVGRAERLFQKGRVSTVEGVHLVAERYKLRSIPMLIQTLSSVSSRTRDAAFEALYGFGDPAFRRLLNLATEGSGEQRLAAVTYLGEWGDPRAVDALITALKLDQGDRTRKKVGEVALYAVFTTILIAILVLLAAVFGADCSSCSGGGNCFACELSDDIRLRMQAAKSLAQIGDLHAVGALARMTQDKAPGVAKAATEALLELLPKANTLREEEAGALGPDGVPQLAALLGKANDRMAQAILATFRAVGDARALPALEKLARDYSRDRALRDEARDLRAVVTERVAREEIRMTLLRAADADNTTPSEELLRPAQSQISTEPQEQLLRAGNIRRED